jgi:hypothetical protein
VKPGDLVTVDKGFAGKHGSGIVIATRSRYPNDPREEELVVTVVHPKTGALKKWSSHYLEVISAV